MKILLTTIYGLITGFSLLIILSLVLSPFGMCICDVPGVTHYKEAAFLVCGALGAAIAGYVVYRSRKAK